MKLNKMLALALSGVMAVSMLAGCSGAPSNGEEDTQVQPTTSNAVSVMNNLQSKVEFKADTTLDADLAAAVKNLKSDVISKAPAGVTIVSNSGNDAKLYEEVEKALPGGYELTTDITFENACTGSDKTTTQTVLYWVKAANLNEVNVLTLVANALNTGDYVDLSNSNYKDYDVDYTGAISIVKASATSEAGTTYNAYVVAVRVNQIVDDTPNEA